MQLPDLSAATTDSISTTLCKEKKVEMTVLRLDKIHPVISGNKWFKLKYHLEKFQQGDYKGILTFGGAWSNHIIAAACAANIHCIKSTGIIRGEEPGQLTYTLQQAKEYGMNLHFISRKMYAEKDIPAFIHYLDKLYPGYYLIPEGGAGPEGEKGAAEILAFFNNDQYSHIVCAIGTFTMFNGIAAIWNKSLSGVPVLKGINPGLETESKKIFTGYHFGGYAKYTQDLIRFMNEFYRQTGIPTDFVYTGKLMYAITDLLKKDFFPQDSRILVIHSGGLQGNNSLPAGTLIF